MFLTQEDFRRIEEYLKLNSKKDSDFDEVFQVTPQDKVAIVQHATNKSIKVSNLLKGGIPEKAIDISKLDDDVIERLEANESNITQIQQQLGGIASGDSSLAELIQNLIIQSQLGSLQHVITTKENYDALATKGKRTLYLIVDSLDEGWVFGDSLPIILS